MITTISRTATTITAINTFTNAKLTINASEWDVVYSYFLSTSNNINIANNFSTLLFTISQECGISSLELIENLKGTSNTLQMNQVMCYYLNTFREKYAMYGVTNVLKPNEAVQRNIVV